MNRKDRLHRFVRDVLEHTPFIKMLALLVALWLVFGAAVYAVERGTPGGVGSLGEALYWAVAAFSTAGIADTPATGWGMAIGGVWIVLGSVIFFGTIVATVTTYFTRPMQRPHRRIIDTIEFNLEQLDQLDLEELDLLRETVDTLIEHMEGAKARHQGDRDQTTNNERGE